MRLATHPSALRGLRVLDLSEGVAGPYCTKLLAGFGAQVTKVEQPGGDRTRGGERERSPLFLHLNTGAALDATQVLTDPHLAARGFFQWHEHPVAGTSPHSSLPWLMDGQRPPVRRPAPCYAQDLDYALDELLGVSAAEKEDLLARRVVSREPVSD